MFLDEPTAGLDLDSKQRFMELINRIKGHKTIIISTHDLEEANLIADRVCIMSNGKFVTIDTPENLKLKYGVGYNLIIEDSSKTGKDKFDQIFNNYSFDNLNLI